jgi:hypothetical protein
MDILKKIAEKVEIEFLSSKNWTVFVKKVKIYDLIMRSKVDQSSSVLELAKCERQYWVSLQQFSRQFGQLIR